MAEETNKWEAFSDEELDLMESAFSVANTESQLWKPGIALWNEIKSEMEKRGNIFCYWLDDDKGA